MVHKCRGSFVYQSHLFMLILGTYKTNTWKLNNLLVWCAMQCPHSWSLSPLCCYSLPLHIQSYKLQSYKLQPNEVTMGHSGHTVVTCPHPATYPATSPSHLTPCTGPLLICRSMNNAQTFYKNLNMKIQQNITVQYIHYIIRTIFCLSIYNNMISWVWPKTVTHQYIDRIRVFNINTWWYLQNIIFCILLQM